ncbi:hypothetical protein F3K50_22255 [Pseudomonas marginalis]|nr:hypothetical protein F3K50_22255 [Pseudomonas marginalis]
MPTEKRTPKETKAQQFVDSMIRCRGIEFAKLGMMVEVDGDLGTIVGMNGSANLDVQFANQLQYGKHAHNCHPTWNVKYFDAAGKVIAHFDECKCVFRPLKEAA